MKKIVKVIFSDNEKLDFEETAVQVLETDTEEEKFEKHLQICRNVRQFERKILEHINSSVVEDFARDHFDLIHESEAECDEVHLDTCTDKEIINEATNRGLMNRFNQNVINQNFEKRFSKIVERENAIFIDEWLTEMENRLRIVS